MRRDASGRWRCPECYKPGDDPVSLARGNAAGARRRKARKVLGPPPETPIVFGDLPGPPTTPYTIFGSDSLAWARADMADASTGFVRRIVDPNVNIGDLVASTTRSKNRLVYDEEIDAPAVDLDARLDAGQFLGTVNWNGRRNNVFPFALWMVAKFSEYSTPSGTGYVTLGWAGVTCGIFRLGESLYQGSGIKNVTPYSLGSWLFIVAYWQGATGIGPSDFLEVSGVRTQNELSTSSVETSYPSVFPWYWPLRLAEAGFVQGSADFETKLTQLKSYLSARYQGLTV